MPDERYLKDIAAELKLIRKELQRMNNPLEEAIEDYQRLMSNRIMKKLNRPQQSEFRLPEVLTEHGKGVDHG